MPLYEMTPDAFRPLSQASFADLKVRERDDLQRVLRTQIDVLGDDLYVLTEEFGDEGGEEVRGGGAGGGELRFQRVHQGHQLLHFGHDPVLFFKGWQGNRDKHHSSQSQILVADTVSESLRLVIAVR